MQYNNNKFKLVDLIIIIIIIILLQLKISTYLNLSNITTALGCREQ